jgi:hypothetical protein
MSAPSAIISQRCNCGRSKEHLHFSSTHDFFVKFGLVLLLSAQAVDGVQGFVKGATTLNLSYDVIAQYGIVNSKITELIAPYEYVNWLAIGLELITLVFAIVAVASLHSIKGRSTHDAAVVGTMAAFVFGMIVKWYYIRATDAALARLPSMVDARTMETWRQLEYQFRIAYGFWGTPGPNAANVLCSLFGLGLFMSALFTSHRYTVWQPVPSDLSSPLPRTPEPARPVIETVSAVPTIASAKATKFCRYCGTKIVRDSKFCEECGVKLI